MKRSSFGVVQNFRRLFARAAADGRGDALFGADALEKAAAALRRGAILGAEDGASFYFEFPFTGPARMDLMVSYGCASLPSSCAFEEGDGYGFRSFFEDCAADPALSTHICGYSFDLSDMADKGAESESNPGVYLLPPFERANVDYVTAMLARLGGEDRVPKVMEAFAAAPSCWRPYYAGYMPGRRGAPTRLGFIVPNEATAHYKETPGRLAGDVEAFAGIALSAGGREALSLFSGSGGAWDLQFDLRPDGTFTDDLGVTLDLGFKNADSRKAAGFLEKGFAGEVMERIEAMGLADARWRLMDKACFGLRRFVKDADGNLLRVGDMVELNAVKVRFKRGEAHLAKGYLLARSRLL
ncbi:MAG: hypothetical protein IJ812_03710 [Schwartzia sp.]|nr:hypothetical protein [Schwartzia sp. (in: firmicutes)]